MREEYSRISAHIALDAIAHNFEAMHNNIDENTKIIAVIKADGYGHGAVPIAHLVESYPYIWGFATATVEEALELRRSGVKKPILLLGYSFEEHFMDIIEQDLRPAAFTVKWARQLAETAALMGREVSVHLAVDTGMSRIGLPDDERGLAAAMEIAKLPNLRIEGLFTHFARADETDKAPAYRQLERYLAFADALERKGLRIPVRHCSNSAGILRIREANLNAVRAGISIYGIYPSDEVERDQVILRQAMQLKSQITYIKTVPPGTAVSYGGTFVTERETVVATVPVGYADGYPRSLSNKGYVLVHGKKAPILGRVCMDQFMIDVTDIPEAEVLSEVTLMGEDGGEVLSVDTLSELSGRFPYEFVCDVSKRVPRIYTVKGRVVDSRTWV